MTCGEEISRLTEEIGRLQEAQLAAEESVVNAINRHDRLMKIIRDVMAETEETFGNMDMVNMAITAALEDTGLAQEQKDCFFQMNDQNAGLIEQLLRKLQTLLKEAEDGSEVIHKMEDEIAQVQEEMEIVCRAVEEFQ